MGILKGSEAVTRWICSIGAGVSMAAMFLIILVNSIRRYTIGKSFEWGEELPIYLGIYGMMFGAALAYLQDRHIRFTILLDLLPNRFINKIFIAVDVLVSISGALLAYSGYLFVLRRGAIEASGLIGRLKTAAQATDLTWLEIFGHMAVWQSAIIVGGVLITIASLIKFCQRLSAEISS